MMAILLFVAFLVLLLLVLLIVWMFLPVDLYDVVIVERGNGWHDLQVKAVHRHAMGYKTIWVITDRAVTASTNTKVQYLRVTHEQVATMDTAFNTAAKEINFTRPWIFMGDTTFPWRDFNGNRLHRVLLRCMRHTQSVDLVDPTHTTELLNNGHPLTLVCPKKLQKQSQPGNLWGHRWVSYQQEHRATHQSALHGYWHNDMILYSNVSDQTTNDHSLKHLSCSTFVTFHFPNTSGTAIGQGYTQAKQAIEAEFS